MTIKLPLRITVDRVLSSRYGDATTGRPSNWDRRKSGVDVVSTCEGKTVKLMSSGQQSVPMPGWVLLLTGGDSESGHVWTLYGMPKGASVSAQ